jgi:hypothetical protein
MAVEYKDLIQELSQSIVDNSTISNKMWYENSAGTQATMIGTVAQTDEGHGVRYATFDGSGYFRLSDNSRFKLSDTSFTIEGFFRRSPALSQSAIVAKGNVGWVSNPSYSVVVEPSNLLTVLGDSHSPDGSRTQRIYGTGSGTAWTYFAVSRDLKSNVISVYVDGTRTDQQPVFNLFTDNNEPLLIGSVFDTFQLGGLFRGDLANIRISRTALYQGPTIRVPRGIMGKQEQTVLLMNFGGTALPREICGCDPDFCDYATETECGNDRFRRLRLLGYV